MGIIKCQSREEWIINLRVYNTPNTIIYEGNGLKNTLISDLGPYEGATNIY